MAAGRAAATAASVGRQHVTSDGRVYVLVEGRKRGRDSVVLYWVLQDSPPPPTHRSSASSVSLPPPTLDSVPDTHIWEVRVDPGRGREFYLNIQSGQKVWELPADGAPGAPVDSYVRKRQALLTDAAAATAAAAAATAAAAPPAAASSSPPVRRLAAAASAVGASAVVPSPLARSPVQQQQQQQVCGWREGSAGTDVFSVLSDETAEPAFLSPIVPAHTCTPHAALHLSPEALFVDFAKEEEGEWRQLQLRQHSPPPPPLAAASAATAAAPSWRRDTCAQPVTASLVADGVLSVRRPAAVAAAAAPAPAAAAAAATDAPRPPPTAAEAPHAAAYNPLMGGAVAAVQAAPAPACDLNASVVSTWEDEVSPAFAPPPPPPPVPAPAAAAAAAPPAAAAGTFSSALSTGVCELGGGRGWTPPEASAVPATVPAPRVSCDVVSAAGDESRGFYDDDRGDDDDDYALCAEEEGFAPTVVTAAPLAAARRWAAAVPVVAAPQAATAAAAPPAPAARSDDDDAASVADLRQQIAVLMSAQAQHTREVQGLREELRRVRAGASASPPRQLPAQATPAPSAVRQQPEAGDAQQQQHHHHHHRHPQEQEQRPRPRQPSQPRRQRLRPSSDGLVHVRPLRRASSSSSASAASTQPAAQGKRGSSGSQRRPLQPIVNQRQPFR